MADTATIAVMRSRALQSIEASANRLSEITGATPPTLTRHNIDPAWLHAKQLSELSDWLEVVIDHLAGLQVPIIGGDVSAATDVQLMEFARRHGYTGHAEATRADAEAWLNETVFSGSDDWEPPEYLRISSEVGAAWSSEDDGAPVDVQDLTTLTKADLLEIAEPLGFEAGSRTTRAEVLEWLQVHGNGADR